MADYTIIRYQGGDFGIRADSDRAGNRTGSGRSTKGLTLAFKTGHDAAQFVIAGASEGYTFDGKEQLRDYLAA
jgi:hypothetical protein